MHRPAILAVALALSLLLGSIGPYLAAAQTAAPRGTPAPPPRTALARAPQAVALSSHDRAAAIGRAVDFLKAWL